MHHSLVEHALKLKTQSSLFFLSAFGTDYTLWKQVLQRQHQEYIIEQRLVGEDTHISQIIHSFSVQWILIVPAIWQN